MMINLKTKVYTGRAEVSVKCYGNRTICLLLDDPDTGPLFKATVALEPHQYPLRFDAAVDVAIKDWSENEGIKQSLIDAGIIQKEYDNAKIGFVTATFHKLTRNFIEKELRK